MKVLDFLPSEQLDEQKAELRRCGVVLEHAADILGNVAGHSDPAIAQNDYEYARDCFREQLFAVTGISSCWIERALAL